MNEIKINEMVTPETVDYNRIYLYTNFDWCEKHPLNRVIDEKLVKKYKKSMLEGASDELIGVMIIDINTFYEYDGQHRIDAFKEAFKEGFNRPLRVMFINAPTDEKEQIELITQLNNGKHWNNYDFINCHKDGDNDLRKLEQFCFKHPRLYKETKTGKNKGKKTAFYRRAAAIVTGDPTYYKKSITDGTFKVDEEMWEDAENTYKEAMKIIDASGLGKQTDIPAIESIFNAWFAIRNDYHCRRKIEKLPNKFEDVYDTVYNNLDTTHTTKIDVWKNRFKNLIDIAYKQNFK